MNYIERLNQTAGFIKDNINCIPEIAIVLGSGLNRLADKIDTDIEISYEDIPNFPRTTVVGHDGKLIFGTLSGKKIVAMKGRFHYYEGWEMQDVIFPVRVMKLLGINNILMTNAAGGVNKQFKPGDLMIIKDHISLFVDSPLRGENYDELGTRFPDMSNAYDKSLIEVATQSAKELDIELRKGVYVYTKGPMFETPSDIVALRGLGADAVGMSTVPEVISAVHMGMKVLGISCITNMAAGILKQPLTHKEVIETGKMVEQKFSLLVSKIIEQWD